MPVYFGSDSSMRLNLLKEVVLKMEEKGFKVRGASFDLGNKEFLSDINFKNGTHKIENPADQVLLFFGRFPTHDKAFS